MNYGDLCLQEGSYTDALDFYAGARHKEGIEKISQYALSNGDAFLFSKHSGRSALNLRILSGKYWRKRLSS
jgi:hypothetical protein